MQPIETSRLRIRLLTIADAAQVLKLVNTEGFITHIGDRGVRDESQAKQYLEQGTLASYEQHGFGMFAVEDRATGEWLGQAGLIKRDHLPFPDIGYALLPQYEGQGFATEAAMAVLKWAKQQGLKQLYGVISPSNQASANVLQKLGFTSQGLIDWQPDEQVMLFQRAL
ncbi:GNAT family N-acetyltransferase [Shewanella sp. Scap07]|uniref:GNAT family N-acetyltransferase n=1 Tax=Shewanella sp. Scap07 TaxID=2589987 RepID=UPI0015BDBFE9|nr:GNAT family N-acetyltransferase [Shewanella sp. Scap07]QLE85286.1 GNAT family N-acetyltransferase [Shewanella sp. Scap07]